MDRRFLLAFYTVAVGLYVGAVLFYIHSPLRFDETEWPPQARAILKRGVPKVLYEEENILRDGLYYGYDAHYGMWHPPAYLYSLALGVKAFGYRTQGFRLVGVLFFLLSLFVVWKISAVLDEERAKDRLLRFLPVSLCLMCPLLVEGSFYLDIDNTVLSLLILVFIYFFLKFYPKSQSRALLFSGLLLTACLWAKLSTPIFLLVAIAFYLLLNREGILKTLKASFIIGGVGIGLFALTYLAYCRGLDYPASFMFDVSYMGKSGKFLVPHGIREAVRSLRYNFIWISPMLSVLLFVTMAVRIRGYVATRRLEGADFLLIFALIGLLFYMVWSPTTHGKYTFPLVMVGLTVSGNELKRYLVSWQSRAQWVFAFIPLGLLFYLLLVPVLQVQPPPAAVTAASSLFRAVLARRNLNIFLSVLPLVFLLILGLRRKVGEPRARVVMRSVFCCILLANFSNLVKTYLSGQEYSPYRPLNEKGFLETVEYLNGGNRAEDVILSPKDFGFYYKGKYYSFEDVLIWKGGVEAFKRKLRSPDIDFIVDSVTYPLVSLSGTDLENLGLRLVRRIGDYAVYEKSYPLGNSRSALPDGCDDQL